MDFMVMGPNAVLTLSNKKVIGYLMEAFSLCSLLSPFIFSFFPCLF